jgi:hypothetical protein
VVSSGRGGLEEPTTEGGSGDDQEGARFGDDQEGARRAQDSGLQDKRPSRRRSGPRRGNATMLWGEGKRCSDHLDGVDNSEQKS